MNLKHKRILITRPRAQAEEFANALFAEGAQPIFFPVIQIVPPNDFSELDHALQILDQYDWMIFTSIHSVDSFFLRLDVLGIKKIPLQLRTAAVGSRTAQRLSENGITVDYVPREYTAEAILQGLSENVSGQRFLFPKSNVARTFLANEIRSAGGIVDEIVAYRNIANEPEASQINELLKGVDIITFASPSAVESFVVIARKNGLDPFNLPGAPLIACIGPSTGKAAEKNGFINLAVAREHTTMGLIETIGNMVIN